MPDNIPYRVEQLESKVKGMNDKLDTIMNNHLPHLQIELTRVSTTVKIFGALIMTGITALILMGLTP